MAHALELSEDMFLYAEFLKLGPDVLHDLVDDGAVRLGLVANVHVDQKKRQTFAREGSAGQNNDSEQQAPLTTILFDIGRGGGGDGAGLL